MNQEERKISRPDIEILSGKEYSHMSDHLFSVSIVKHKIKGITQEGAATGFFYEHNKKLYFITNKHVVCDKKFKPDELVLMLHTHKDNLGKTSKPYCVPLYIDGLPAWFEHPDTSMDIDVVALPLELPPEYCVTPFNERDCILGNYPNSQAIYVPIGEDLVIVGYPEGLYDSLHNMPIIRRGSFASVYPIYYTGKPQFLIDAILHNGTSGSPVLLKARKLIIKDSGGGRLHVNNEDKRYLIGIHSGDYDESNAPLSLHIVWYAELINEIIEQDGHRANHQEKD